MNVHQLFSVKLLDDILRNTFSLPNDNKLKYSLYEGDNNKCTIFLDVKAEGVCQQYVLIKVSDSFKSQSVQQNIQNNSVLQPVFIIENKQKVTYGAFEKKLLDNFVFPGQNNLDQLKVILKTLAQFQATILAAIGDIENQSEYAVDDITENIISLDYFKTLEKAIINETLGKLQDAFNRLLKSNLLVKSVWSSLASNVYINKDGTDSLILEVSPQKLLPPAYDALLYIFSFSDEKFRQKHFEDLTAYYFKALVDALRKQNSTASEKITRKYTDIQIRTLLPIVKFKFTDDLIQYMPSDRVEEMLANILNYLKYPLMHQEDVYETTKNKLLSNDYDLLSFKLQPLSEKNGHLGEYYHLRISVKFQNKEENLNLFAKFLITSIDMIQANLDSGLDIREDFFYSIFYPLLEDHGLESLLDFAPKCYLTKLSGFLILDDLSSLGYTSLKPNGALNYDGLKIILEKLAKLHASSIIVEELLSKKSDRKIRLGSEFAEYLKEPMFLSDGPMQTIFERALDSVYYTINKFPDLSDKLHLSVEQLNAKLKDIFFSPFSKVKKSDALRNVVNHGDMYVANMLIKFGKGNTVEDGILIDFQALRYVPPAYEVLFFIFISSTKETRINYFNSLLDCYYENLSGRLKQFNLDSDGIYSRKQFNEDVNYVKSASVATAFNYAHLCHINTDFREEIFHDQEKFKYYLEDNKNEFMDLSWKEEHYRVVLRGIMEDFIDLVENYP